MSRRLAAIVAGVLATAACGSDDSLETGETDVVTAADCIVRLHGKGDTGAAPSLQATGLAVLEPTGNAAGWGARQWRYDTTSALDDAISIVERSVDDAGCTHVVLHGFSNGAAFAAALVCGGTTLDGRLVGVVVDDPVTDAATVGCERSPDVAAALYWTGALDEVAPAGTRCESIDWTCSGDAVRGVEAVAADLEVEVKPSPFDEHRWYLEAPEPLTWLSTR